MNKLQEKRLNQLQSQLNEMEYLVRDQTTGANIHRMRNVLSVVRLASADLRESIQTMKYKQALVNLQKQLGSIYMEFSNEYITAIADGCIDQSECCRLHKISNLFITIISEILSGCVEDKTCYATFRV